MKSLETLNLSKNQLREIPLEVAASTSITELFFNDNCLSEVPTKIMTMQNLKIFEAERKLFSYANRKTAITFSVTRSNVSISQANMM